jgi:hypothetical protein
MTNVNKSFGYWIILGTLLILLAVSVLNPWNRQKNASQKPQNQLPKEQIFKEDLSLQQGLYSGATYPSFEMRENVDFLLTPAILVQECLSEGVIFTYPEE